MDELFAIVDLLLNGRGCEVVVGIVQKSNKATWNQILPSLPLLSACVASWMQMCKSIRATFSRTDTRPRSSSARPERTLQPRLVGELKA